MKLRLSLYALGATGLAVACLPDAPAEDRRRPGSVVTTGGGAGMSTGGSSSAPGTTGGAGVVTSTGGTSSSGGVTGDIGAGGGPASNGGASPGPGGAPSSGGASSGSGGAKASGGASSNNGGAPGTGGAGQGVTGSIVPLYSYPTAAPWTAIARAKAAHPAVPVIAIVNPASGPGTQADAAYTQGIAALVSAGIVPIGYVSTEYSDRDEEAVNADIDRWHTLYPATKGIFFDEQSSQSGEEDFYRDVSSYAKSQGFTLTVGNPGTRVPSSFADVVDVMLIYESDGTPETSSLTRYASQRSRYGIIPYAAEFDAAFAKEAAKSVAYVYMTDDGLPNPWDDLPSFFDQLLAALEP